MSKKEEKRQETEGLTIEGVEDLATSEEIPKLSVLIYGPIGTWKTRFAATFPDPILFFDFDGRLTSIADLAREKKIQRIPLQEWYAGPGGTGEPQAFQYANYVTTQLMDAAVKGRKLPYATLVYDSLTTATERATALIKYNNGISQDKPLPWSGGHWADVYELLRGMMSRSLSLADLCNVIWIAHEELIEDKLMGGVRISPMTGGQKWRDRIPVRFREIYHTGVEPGPEGKPVPFVETCSMGLVQARTSFNLPPRIEPSYEALVDYIKTGWGRP